MVGLVELSNSKCCLSSAEVVVVVVAIGVGSACSVIVGQSFFRLASRNAISRLRLRRFADGETFFFRCDLEAIVL